MQPEKVIVDSHLHLDQLAEPMSSGVRASRGYFALIPGIDPPQWRAVLERFGEDLRCDIALGLHPWWSGKVSDDAYQEQLIGLLAHPAVVALGEVGLDHLRHRSEGERARAMEVFRWQVGLAVERGLPLVIHCVRAHGAVMEVLREAGASSVGGVIHAFSGAPELARQYLDLGFVVGLGSPVTRENSRRVRRAAAEVEASGYLLETDAPYMNTGAERAGAGTMANIERVLREVASLRGEAPEVVRSQSAKNYLRIFAQSRLCR